MQVRDGANWFQERKGRWQKGIEKQYLITRKLLRSISINEIKIWYRRRIGHWQLLSVPYTASILFDKTFDNALVNYALYGEGGYAYFKKIRGAWSLIEADRTWIE